MTVLAADRHTNMQDGDIVVLPVAAATKVYAGGMAAVNAAGDSIPAADTSGLKVVGRYEEQVDNSSGAAGDLTVNVRRRKSFWFNNSATNAVTKAHLHGLATIYVEDDNTVSSDGGTNSIVAGIGLAVDATLGVLVEFN